MNLEGQRVAVLGMARSGISVARAVTALGGTATVLDQKPADSLTIISAVDELHSVGVQAVAGWHGRLDPVDHDLLVISPGIPRNHPAVKDMATKEVIGEIEFAYRVSSDPIIAITGTNGKSTTTVLTWTLLNAVGKNAVLCGNIAGSGYEEVTLTDAAMKGGDVLVAEVSSFQLETVKDFRPFVGAITTIAPDHLDRHPDFDDYRRCKLRIFENMRSSDYAILNNDDKSLTSYDIPERVRKVKFSPSGLNSSNGHTARAATQVFLSGNEINASSIPLLGEHNVANVMMAWEMACAILGELERDQADAMLSALLKFKGLANRMETVGERNDVLIVNNSMCTNPSAVVASSRGLAKKQRLLIGGNRKNLDFSPVGDYLRESNHAAYLFGPDCQGLNEQLKGDWPSFDSMQEALNAAIKEAKSGEAVILMPGCASAEPYANFKERGDAFKKMAKEWIER